MKLKLCREIIENKSNDKTVFKSYVYNNNFHNFFTKKYSYLFEF